MRQVESVGQVGDRWGTWDRRDLSIEVQVAIRLALAGHQQTIRQNVVQVN